MHSPFLLSEHTYFHTQSLYHLMEQKYISTVQTNFRFSTNMKHRKLLGRTKKYWKGHLQKISRIAENIIMNSKLSLDLLIFDFRRNTRS